MKKFQGTSFRVVFLKKDSKPGFLKNNERNIQIAVDKQGFDAMLKQPKEEWFVICKSSQEMIQWVNAIAVNCYKLNQFVRFD